MKITPRTVIATFSGIAAIALMVWVFMIIGAPVAKRKIAEDRETLKNLECVACYAERFSCGSKERNYPPTKADILANARENYKCAQDNLRCSHFHGTARRDGKTDFAEISYLQQNNNNYKLCADFNMDSDEQGEDLENKPPQLKNYQSGKQCFVFKNSACNSDQAGYKEKEQ